MIASRVELFAGSGSTYESSKYTRLGYFTLDENEGNDFAARELKTITIDCSTASFIKLIIHPCHVNKFNLFNQVGIVAINLEGYALDENGDVNSPSSKYTYGKFTIAPPADDLYLNHFPLKLRSSTGDNVAKSLLELLELLHKIRDDAALEEDFDTAMIMKANEAHLRTIGEELRRLDFEKRRAVAAEQFKTAKFVRTIFVFIWFSCLICCL